jgi:hypothetical protein
LTTLQHRGLLDLSNVAQTGREKCAILREPALIVSPVMNILKSFALWLKKLNASLRAPKLKPEIAGSGSQRMCPFCGLITSRFKSSCLECGKSLP